MDNAETIRNFLVSLGFQIDEAGAQKFSTVLSGVTTNVLKMGTAVEGAALSVVAFTARIAGGLDNLYWAGQRTGATVQGIQAIGYAISQTGGSTDAARSSLENLARFMRNSPGAEGFLNRLGVKTRDASGNMQDMAAVFTGVGQRLSTMPSYRANQFAQMLGIDENTLMAMRRGMSQFSGEYSQMAKAIGFNADIAAAKSSQFMTSLTAFGQLAAMVRDKIGSDLAGGLAGSLDELRRRVLDNFPKIESVITRIVKGILWLGEVFGRVVWRLVQAAGGISQWWSRLGSGTQNLIALLGGLVVAWRVLNSAFLASPIGMITALIGGLLLLWEDYQTWMEGGKSLIDWQKWQPGIEKAQEAMKWLGDHLLSLTKRVGGWQNAFHMLAAFVAGSWAVRMLAGIARVSKGFGPVLAALAATSAWDKTGRIHDEAAQEGKSVGQYLVDRMNQNQGSSEGLSGKADTWLSRLYAWWDGLSDTGGATNAYDAYGTAAPRASARGIRNNNPGNLNFAGQKGAEREYPGGRFARFGSPFDGLRAMSRQLTLYAGRGINTLEKIISKWAPRSENNTSAYINALAKKLGVAPNAVLNLSNPEVMTSLMNGIVQHENGRNPYSRELVSLAAKAGAGDWGVPQSTSVQQNNSYHIYGGNAAEIGSEVERRQLSANARTLRTGQVRTG